jgi:metal-responsive CopG/Arc/MetJ family transcriptional regulator
MKTAISLPDPVFQEAEALAQRLGMSRSELYTNALKSYLEKHNRSQRLKQLDQIYTQELSNLDAMMAKMQFMSLPSEDW